MDYGLIQDTLIILVKCYCGLAPIWLLFQLFKVFLNIQTPFNLLGWKHTAAISPLFVWLLLSKVSGIPSNSFIYNQLMFSFGKANGQEMAG